MAYTLRDAQKIIPTISKDTIKCMDQEAAVLGFVIFILLLPTAIILGLLAFIPTIRERCIEAIYDLAIVKSRICQRYLINRICDKN